MRATRAGKPDDGGKALLPLEDCHRLLAHDAGELNRARALLTLLGDDMRRTIIERLTIAPQIDLRTFATLTAGAPADVSHRLRSLCRAEVLVRDRHRGHHVQPDALKALSNYFDVLLLASARSQAITR